MTPLAASHRSALAHFAKGQVLRSRRLYAEAIPEYETAIASNRNRVSAFTALGQCKLFAGSIEETSPLLEQAVRHSPCDPRVEDWYFQIVHLLHSDGRFSSIARLKSVVRYFGVSKVRALYEASYLAGLRKAGMPEE